MFILTLVFSIVIKNNYMCTTVLIVTVIMQHVDWAFVNCKCFLFYNTCRFRQGFREGVMGLSPPLKFEIKYYTSFKYQKWPQFFKPSEPSEAYLPWTFYQGSTIYPLWIRAISLTSRLYFTHPNDKTSVPTCYYLSDNFNVVVAVEHNYYNYSHKSYMSTFIFLVSWSWVFSAPLSNISVTSCCSVLLNEISRK